ncbi:MAG: hypothetical protein P8Y37_11890, partial [Anaerolineales bacterium]
TFSPDSMQFTLDPTGVAYSVMDSMIMTITNTGLGPLNFELTDEDVFGDYSGCVLSGQQVDLVPGEAYYLTAVFDGDPSGHKIKTKIRICTKDDLGGDCLTKTITHTP